MPQSLNEIRDNGVPGHNKPNQKTTAKKHSSGTMPLNRVGQERTGQDQPQFERPSALTDRVPSGKSGRSKLATVIASKVPAMSHPTSAIIQTSGRNLGSKKDTLLHSQLATLSKNITDDSSRWDQTLGSKFESVLDEQDSRLPAQKRRTTLLDRNSRMSSFQLSVREDEVSIVRANKTALMVQSTFYAYKHEYTV